MKPLAPFGQHLVNQHDVIIIFMGPSSVERATSFYPEAPYTLYLPPQTSPARYSWPVHSCEVYLCDTDDSKNSFIQFCAVTFFSYGAKEVRYISRSRLFTIKKGILS